MFGDGCDSRYKTVGSNLYLCKKGFSHTACNAENCTKKDYAAAEGLIGKVFQHFKGGVYLVLHVTPANVVKYMRLSDKEIFDRPLSEFTGDKVATFGGTVKRFRLLDGYSFVDGAQNERERILDLIDREIESTDDYGLRCGMFKIKKLIEKSVGD